MIYKVIGTGSDGNAVVINSSILIDCGVPFRSLAEVYKGLRLVLLTHIHSDHFKKRTLRKLAQERPTLRFACCDWLVLPLIECGVKMSQIDVLECGKEFDYGAFQIQSFELTHDVPNCGYKLFMYGKKLIYATDTANLDGVEAKDFDLYMIEANYEEEELEERLRSKEENGEYAYERNVRERHLSKRQCDDFVYSNIGSNGVYVYLHRHRDKKGDG